MDVEESKRDGDGGKVTRIERNRDREAIERAERREVRQGKREAAGERGKG
jgi:hypothetical protein